MQTWSVDSLILSGAQPDTTDTLLSLRQEMGETVDGSVVEHYLGFEAYMREGMRAMDGITADHHRSHEGRV